jgi:CHAD domain-containing protein
MAFSFQPDESIKNGFQRILLEEIRCTIEELSDDSIKRTEKVHRARRHGKQLRSLLRLVSPGLGQRFRTHDRWIRDTSRALSNFRDAKTVLDAYCGLVQIDEVTPELLSKDDVLSELDRHRRSQLGNKKSIDRAIAKTLNRYQQLLNQASKLPLRGKGLFVLREGLCETYQHGRRAMGIAIENDQSLHFHEWRKYVKYHLHHCRLIAPTWPKVMMVRIEELDELGDLLGTEHDLAVLSERVKSRQETLDVGAVASVLQAAHLKRNDLQNASLALGKRLFAESSHAFVQRHVAYWKMWRE